ncbi:MAG: hypothetical protein HYU64_13535 [Armatimonadetes bacterium]|nr:hypothetical protein [Armatimonadota bacterium]
MDNVNLRQLSSDVVKEWHEARELVKKHGKEKPDSALSVPDSVTISKNRDIKKVESPKFHAVETKTEESLASGSHIDTDPKTTDEVTLRRNEEIHVYERSGLLGLIPKENGTKTVIRETLTDFKEQEVDGQLQVSKITTTWTKQGHNAVAGKTWTEVKVDAGTGQLLEYEICDEKGVKIIVHKGEVVRADTLEKADEKGVNLDYQNVKTSEAKGAPGVLFQEPRSTSLGNVFKTRLLESLQAPAREPSDDLEKARGMVQYLRDMDEMDPEILSLSKKFFEEKVAHYKEDKSPDGQLAFQFLTMNQAYLKGAEEYYGRLNGTEGGMPAEKAQDLLSEVKKDVDFVQNKRNEARQQYQRYENGGPQTLKRAYHLETVTLGLAEKFALKYLRRIEQAPSLESGVK